MCQVVICTQICNTSSYNGGACNDTHDPSFCSSTSDFPGSGVGSAGKVSVYVQRGP